MFHLEDRLLDVDRLDDVDVTKPIDWEIVNNILEKTRKEFTSKLEEIINSNTILKSNYENLNNKYLDLKNNYEK